jgi:hypothetical protein
MSLASGRFRLGAFLYLGSIGDNTWIMVHINLKQYLYI